MVKFRKLFHGLWERALKVFRPKKQEVREGIPEVVQPEVIEEGLRIEDLETIGETYRLGTEAQEEWYKEKEKVREEWKKIYGNFSKFLGEAHECYCKELDKEMKRRMDVCKDASKNLISVYREFLNFVEPELYRFPISEDLKDEIKNAYKEHYSEIDIKPKFNYLPYKGHEFVLDASGFGYKMLDIYKNLKKWTNDINWEDRNMETACRKVSWTLRDYARSSLVNVHENVANTMGLDPSKLIPLEKKGWYTAMGFIITYEKMPVSSGNRPQFQTANELLKEKI